MDNNFMLEDWVFHLLNQIADASAKGKDFTLHLNKEETRRVQEVYARTRHIEIY